MNGRPGPALRPCSKRDPGGDRSQEPSSLEAALPGAEGAPSCLSAGRAEHKLWAQKTPGSARTSILREIHFYPVSKTGL